jgi:hypothetical protein
MINLNHTVEEINLMISALRELPHKLVHELITKITAQAQPQVNALEKPAELTVSAENQ